MSDKNQLALDILNALNIAVLERVGERKFAVLGDPPAFYNKFFPPNAVGYCAEPWEHSPMLDLFIKDAELFFEKETQGAFSSGVWQEDGKAEGETALIAEAIYVGDRRVITIRCLQEDYRDRVGILNDMRNNLLEQRQVEQNLESFREKSRIDALTGLFNRATFVELLHGALAESNAKMLQVSLVMLDIDNFKKFNDTYGHLAGDEVLRSLGVFIQDCCTGDEIAARYGGEEFCVVLRDVSQENTLSFAHKICEGVRKIRIAALPAITISVGCAIYRRNESSEQFIKRADMALYDIKYSTKNGVSMR
ncbi:MAG: GGDEF domain-containing protein [Helicobacteraceae bacterium]|jgi:diguanylate cyclase (GGDEF)-like protein|nr:GGDEF domain-containing protein [Helicobacteraceae bacterium]